MPNDQPPDDGNTLIATANAALGLPALSAAVAPSALRGLNALVGSAFAIPTTWLQGVTEGIEDRNFERRLARRAMASAAVERGKADEDLVERTVDRLFARELKRQSNRENVARLLLLEMHASRAFSPDEEPEPVADEFLERLGDFAGEASTEEAQLLWAKVLARESYRPGSVSVGTMDVIARLSRQDAESFMSFVPSIFIDGLPRDVVGNRGHKFENLLRLKDVGLFSGGSSLSWSPARDEKDGRLSFLIGKTHALGFVLPEPRPLELGIHVLTRAGDELLDIVRPGGDEAAALVVAELISAKCEQILLFERRGEDVVYRRVVFGSEQVDASMAAVIADGITYTDA